MRSLVLTLWKEKLPDLNPSVTESLHKSSCTPGSFCQIAASVTLESQIRITCIIPVTRFQIPKRPIIMSEDQTSECENSPCCKPGRFSWNELVTTDVEGASAFYTHLLGWTATQFSPEYTIFNKDGQGVAGLMKTPVPGRPAQWVAYVTVVDVDASVAQAAELGGQVAPFGLFKPLA